MNKEPSEKLTDIIVVDKFSSIFRSAKDRGIEFNLSFKTVKRLLRQQTCFYTGKVFTQSGKNSRTFDRVDASKGYIEGNVVACCQDINHKKKDLTIEEINLLYHKIKRKTKTYENQRPKPNNRITSSIRLEGSLLSSRLD